MQQEIHHLLIELFHRHGLPMKLGGYDVDEFEAKRYPVIETSAEQLQEIISTPFSELEKRARIAIADSLC